MNTIAAATLLVLVLVAGSSASAGGLLAQSATASDTRTDTLTETAANAQGVWRGRISRSASAGDIELRLTQEAGQVVGNYDATDGDWGNNYGIPVSGNVQGSGLILKIRKGPSVITANIHGDHMEGTLYARAGPYHLIAKRVRP